MSDGREVGRITDGEGRIVVVGVDDSMVTLRTLHTRTSGAVKLGAYDTEELGQYVVSAAWQAGWSAGKASAGGAES